MHPPVVAAGSVVTSTGFSMRHLSYLLTIFGLLSCAAAQDTVQIYVNSATVTEGGTATFHVYRNDTTADQVVNLAITGTATGTDYTGATTTITVLAGSNEALLDLAVAADGVPEDDETITVTIQPGAYGIEPGYGAATILIDENDGSSRILTLDGPAQTLDFQVAGDTDPCLFTLATTGLVSVQVAPGGTGPAIPGWVYVYDNALGGYYGGFSFAGSIGSEVINLPAGTYRAEVYGNQEGTCTVQVQTSADVVRVTGAALISEGGQAIVSFRRIGTTGALPVTVTWSGDGLAEVTGTTSPVTIADVSTVAQVVLVATDDAIPEDDQVITATVVAGTGYGPDASEGTLSIVLDENDGFARSVQVGTAQTAVAQAAGDVDWFPLTISANDSYAVSLRGVASGAGTQSSAYIYLYQADKSTYITGTALNSATDARLVRTLAPGDYWIQIYAYQPGTAQLLVEPNQVLTISSVTSSAVEGGSIQLSIAADRTATRAKSITLSVSGAATFASGDLVAPSAITLPAGTTSLSVIIPVAADALIEGVESASIQLASGDYSTSGSVNVTVSDPPGTIIRVKADATGLATGASWADALPSLVDALQVAAPGSEVWVAAGTYRPTTGTDTYTSFTPPRGVAIYGGFAGTEMLRSERVPTANVVVLSGDIGVPADTSDNSQRILYISQPDVVIDGVTVRDAFGGQYGAGIYLGSTNAVITRTTVTANTGSSGAGIYVGGGPTLISRCRITGNTSGNNTYGAGIYASTSADLRVESSLIAGNTIGTGGYGGGIYWYAYGNVSVLSGCTIAGNSGPTFGAIYGANGPTLTDCVIWGNPTGSGAPIYLNLTPATSIIEGSTVGGTISSADPLFVDAVGGDYSLQAGSPAIDRGGIATAPAYDLVGRPRGAAPDAGAIDTTTSAPVTDNAAPAITLVNPASGSLLTTTNSVTLSGTASDDVQLAAVTWRASGATNANGTATGLASWTIPLTLTAGLTAIDITVTDTSGNRATVTVAIEYRTVGVSTPDLVADRTGTNTAILRLTRTGDLSLPLQVGYNVTGTAIAGLDYPSLGASATFGAGQSTVDLVVAPVDGGIETDDQSIILTLLPAANVGLGTATGTVWIAEVARPVTPGTPLSSTINYGSDEDWYSFTVSRQTDMVLEMRGAATSEGTISDPYLYFYGPDKKTTLIASDDDSGAGLNSLITRRLQPGIYYVKCSRFGSSTGTYVLDVHEQPATVSITGTDLTATEGGDTATLTVARAGNVDAPLTVLYTVAGSGSSPGTPASDIAALVGSLQLPAGVDKATITVTAQADSTVEGAETVQITLSASPDYVVGSPASQIVTIKEAGGKIIHVKAGATGGGLSWADAMGDLRLALVRAAPGDQVWIAEGTYRPDPSNQSYSFTIPAQVAVLGGFPANGNPDLTLRNARQYQTILSGNIGDTGLTSDDSSTVVTMNSGNGTNLDGVIVERGRSYGIYASSVQGLVIGSTVVRSCTGSSGAGIYANSCTGTIANSLVHGCVSSSTGGGLYLAYGNLTLANVAVLGNTVTSASGTGGGIYAAYGTFRLRNCTIAGNAITSGAAGQGAGLYVQSSPTTVTAGIFAANLSGAVGDQVGPATGTAIATVSDSLVETALPASFTSTGNVVGAAVFNATASIAGADLQYLTSDDGYGLAVGDTLAKDAATGATTSGDIAGVLRPQGAAADRGAYEATTGPPTPDTSAPALAITTPAASPVLIGTGSSSFTVQGTVDAADAVSLTYAVTGASTANGSLSITASWSVGLSFNVGTSMVVFTARDAAGNAAIASFTVERDQVSLTAVTAVADRNGPQSAVLRLTRTANLTVDEQVNVTIGGTAVAGTDYTAITTPVVILAGSATRDILVTPATGAAPQDDLTVTVAVAAGPATYAIGTPSSTSVRINDGQRSLALGSSATGSIDTAGDTDWFSFTVLSRADYRIEVRGSAASAGTLSDPNATLYGPDTRSALIVRDDDTLGGLQPQIIRTLDPGTYFIEVGANGTQTGTYTVSVAVAATTVKVVATDPVSGEVGPDLGQVTVSRVGDLSFPITVLLGWSGTAQQGIDVETLPGSVILGPGQSSQTITVTPLSDTVGEGDEFVICAVQAGTGYVIGSPASANLVVRDEFNRTLYVDGSATGAANGTSWANAYLRIEQALTAALPGDQVWIAQGTYTPTAASDRNASFTVGAKVSLFGGFAGGETDRGQRDPLAHQVILSGAIGTAAATDNSITVLILASDTILDGVTVRDAYGTASGAGIRVGNSTNVTIVGCRILGNATTASGGGLYVDINGGATVVGCEFSGNSAGGNGGAISNGSARSSVVNCLFTANTAVTGGAIYTGAALVNGCSFAGNTGTTGAAIYTTDATIRNSAVAGSVGAVQVTAAGLVADSVIQGGATGASAIIVGGSTADPLFVSAADLHLQAGSPAIGLADPAFATGSDFAGAIRDASPDAGAYESGASVPSTPDTTAPTVAITGPTSQPVLVQGTTGVSLSGSASDDRGLVSVAWSMSGATSGAGTVQGLTAWTIGQLTLNPGTTFITVNARDAGGNVASDRLQVDVVQVALQLVDQLAGESSGGSASVRLTRTGSTTDPLPVALGWTAGAGLVLGTDVANPPTSVIIPAGAPSVLVTVAALADGTAEGADESLTVSIAADPTYQTGNPSSQVLWLIDDTPTALLVGGSGSTGSIDYAGTPADSDRFTFVAAASGTYQVDVRGASSAGGTLTYPRIELYGPDNAGQFVASATYGGTGNDARMTRDLSPGTYTVVVSSANAGTGSYSVGVRLVGARVSVSAGDSLATEGTGDGASFLVSRVGDFTGALVVTAAVTGTATAGTDFTAITVPITIGAGASSTTVSVVPLTDADAFEDDESVTLTVVAGTDYTVGTASASVWITDEAPTLAVGVPQARRLDRAGDTDQFAITVPNGQTWNAAIQLERVGGAPISYGSLTLLSPVSAQVASASGGSGFGREAVIGYALTAGTWTVRTSGYYASETGDYQVRLTINQPPVATPGVLAATEGVTANGTLSGTDPELQPLTYAIASSTWRGTISLDAATGNYTYTPYSNVNGSDSFTFTVSDGVLTSAPATVNVTVTPVNQAPVGYDQSITVLANTAFYGQLGGSDPDGDIPQRSIVAQGSLGTATITNVGYGAFTYTPNAGAFGTDAFTYQVSDGTFTAGPYTVTVRIDRRPTVTGTSLVTNEDVAVVGSISGSDPDGDPITFAAGTAGKGSVSMDAAGNFTYTPYLNQNGSDSFPVWTTDGWFTSSLGTVSIAITPVNDYPGTTVTGTVALPGVDVSGQLSATDPEGDPITFEIVTFPATGTLELDPGFSTNGKFIYHPPVPAPINGKGPRGQAPVTFVWRAVDSNNLPGPNQVYEIRFNTAPAITQPQPITVIEDTAFDGSVQVTDADGDATTIRVSIQAAHGTVTITNASSGAYRYTPTADYNGSDSFAIVANDGIFDSSPATVAVTVTPVNDAPVATSSSLSVPPSGSANGLLQATDPEGGAIIYELLSTPTAGSFTAFDASTGAFTYQASAGLGAQDVISFRASDGSMVSNTATLTISINTAPTLSVTGAVTDEDTTFNGTVVAGDADGDALTFQVSGITSGASVSINASTGAWSYTPPSDKSGADQFIITVSDQKATTSVQVDVTITAVQDAPRVSGSATFALPTLSVGETGNAGVTVTSIIQGLTGGSVSDPDLDPLGIAVQAADLTLGTWEYTLDGISWQAFPVVAPTAALVLPADGVARLRLAPNPTGGGTVASALTVRAWDRTTGTAGSTADAGTNGGSTAFSTGTIAIAVTVLTTGGPPIANNGSSSTAEDTTLFGNLSGSDPQGQAITFALVSAGAGQVTILADGSFTYIPVADDNGTDQFTFRVSNGVAQSGIATYTVTITAVNDAPVAQALSLVTNEDTAVAGTLVATDVDDEIWTWAVSAQGGLGSLAVDAATGAATYTPNPDATGTDVIQVVATDVGGATSAAALVTVTINPVNDAPVADASKHPVLKALAAGGGNGMTITQLLATATGTITDIDTGALAGIAVTVVDTTAGSAEYSLDGIAWSPIPGLPGGAGLLLPADGVARLRATPIAAGPDFLTIRAWDRTSDAAGDVLDLGIGGGTTAFSTGTTTVSLAINQPPTMSVAAADLAMATIAYDAIAVAADVDSDPITITTPGKPAWLAADLSVASTVHLTGTPAVGDVGTAAFQIGLDDGFNPVVLIDVSITVLAAETAPVVEPALLPSADGATVFNAVSAGTSEGLARLKAALAGRPRSEVRAFAWDAIAQSYAELPAEPIGGLTPYHAIFLASRIPLALDFDGTPTPVPLAMTIQPGWNFVAVPPMRGPGGTMPAADWAQIQVTNASGFPLDAASVVSLLGGGTSDTRPFLWDGAAYARSNELRTGRGYWIRNGGASAVRLVIESPDLIAMASTRSIRTLAAPPVPPGGQAASSEPAQGGGCGSGAGAGFIGLLALVALRFRKSRGR
jgi:hypothetical protein